MPTEQFTNNAFSYITQNISPTDTVIPVYDVSNFPSSPQFRVLVDNEIMLVTGIDGNDFEVEREAELDLNGGAADYHDDLAIISHIQTAGALYATAKGIPTGGSTGEILAKASGTDYDTEWVTGTGAGPVRPNICQFSRFWTNTGWSTVGGPTMTYAMAAPSPVNDYRYGKVYAARMVIGGAGTKELYQNLAAVGNFKVVAGDVISVSGYIDNTSGGGNADMVCIWWNIGGGVISVSTVGTVTAGTGWTRVTNTFTAPTNTYAGHVAFRGNNAGTVYFAAPQVQFGSTVDEYSPRTDDFAGVNM